MVHMIRVLAWVTDTVHGCARSKAGLVSMRTSYSHSHAPNGAEPGTRRSHPGPRP